MFMGILSPYGFCIHVPPLWLDKRNGHYGFGTMDITTFKLQLLVIDRRLKTVETSKTCFKGDFGLMRHFLGPIYTDQHSKFFPLNICMHNYLNLKNQSQLSNQEMSLLEKVQHFQKIFKFMPIMWYIVLEVACIRQCFFLKNSTTFVLY